jgi:regulatory protein
VARLFSRRNPHPLDAEALDRLALHYVGRYATTRAKLSSYLLRKLQERGWAGEGEAPVEALVARVVALGYVDDRAFADLRGAALARRGYGARRISEALRAAGIDEEDGADARDAAEDAAWSSAIAFARRRRIGPFATVAADMDRRRKDFAAMMRAGHSPELIRRLLDTAPGEEPNRES